MYKLIDIPDVKKNSYFISEDGQVYSLIRKKILSPCFDKDGYLKILLVDDSNTGYRKTWRISILVALVYIGSPPKTMIDPTVDHIDSDKLNNKYTNLQWLERGTNSSIRKNKGLGELNHEAVLNEQQVIEICELLKQKIYSLQKIANMYKVNKSTISNIKRKKNWTHITKNYNF